jgi:glycosyltransferase involved in cell wall biosynthesis
VNILIVQYGNYGEAFRRLRSGGPETYRDQRSSVEYVASLAPANEVMVVALTEEEHDLQLSERLHSIGISERQLSQSRIAQVFDRIDPDAFVCATPHHGFLKEARARGVTTLPCFADIFATTGPRSAVRNLRLRLMLAARNITCVANHSLNASRSVATSLRYSRDRVVPWDWKRVPSPYAPKTQIADPTTPTAFFAGMLSPEKGVGDCLRAMKELHRRGIPLSMSFAGQGDVARWRSQARDLGLADAVTFLGLISNDDVRKKMHGHDLIVVPSRHSYAEGLPNTIYEGLASRSPLIISDHPAFRGRLDPDRECVVFKAGNPLSLADAMGKLIGDEALYSELSANSPTALQKLYVGIEWPELMNHFLGDPTNATGWVARHSLKALNL